MGKDGRWYYRPEPCPVEPLPPVVARHYLRNRFGWVFTYEVLEGDLVQILQSYRGAPASSYTMPKPQARSHYRRSLDQGFLKLEGDL
jgi:hypothetical protein